MTSKNRFIVALGLWVAIIPILGFPSKMEDVLTIISGLLIAILAFIAARQRRVLLSHQPPSSRSNDVYVESGPTTDIDEIRRHAEKNKNT